MNWFKKVPFQQAFLEEVMDESNRLEKAILTQRLKVLAEKAVLERMLCQRETLDDAYKSLLSQNRTQTTV